MSALIERPVDALSRLLTLFPVSSALDTRCRLGAPWRIDRTPEAPGIAPYHLVLTGRAVVRVEGQHPIALMAGDLLVLPRGHAHHLSDGPQDDPPPNRLLDSAELGLSEVGNSGSGAMSVVLCGQFMFDARASRPLIDALPDTLVVRSATHPGGSGGVAGLVAMIGEEVSDSRPGGAAILGHLASALFASALRGWMDQSQPAAGILLLLCDPRLGRALQAMLGNLARSWSLGELAALSNMSLATFNRAFRASSATTPGNLLTVLRMQEAMRLLADTARGVGDVAEAVGYQSEAAFNRAFKRHAGMGPGEYRRNALSRAPVPEGLSPHL